MFDISKFNESGGDIVESFVTPQANYLEILKIVHGVSKEADTIPIGHWTFRKEDLGTKVVVMVLNRRMHAIQFEKETNKKTLESFNGNSPVFKKIASDPVNFLNNFGIEYLIYMPEYSAFGLFFCGRPTLRAAGYTMLTCITPVEKREKNKDLPFTFIFELGIKRIELKKRPTYVPDCRPIPLESVDVNQFLPDEEALGEKMRLFTAPVKAENVDVAAVEERGVDR